MKRGKKDKSQNWGYESVAEELAKRPLEDNPPEKVSFDGWASSRLSRANKKEWMREAVREFFKSLDLRDEEKIETYDEAFKKF